MAVKMVHSCDFDKSCDEPAPEYFELTYDKIAYRADVCSDHLEPMLDGLRALGFHPVASIVGGKHRDVFIAASGRPFTAADARAWLVEQGIKNGSAQGRVSAEHLELYRLNH